MIILAIDPGPELSAFVVWDTEKQEFVEENYKHGIISNSIMLDYYYKAIIPNLDIIAIEMIQNYGLSVGRTTFETVLFIGNLIQKLKDSYSKSIGYKIKLYGRPTIKGHFQAKNDAMIRASLRMRYPENEFKKGGKYYGVKKDIWQAMGLAVALTENPNLKEW